MSLLVLRFSVANAHGVMIDTSIPSYPSPPFQVDTVDLVIAYYPGNGRC